MHFNALILFLYRKCLRSNKESVRKQSFEKPQTRWKPHERVKGWTFLLPQTPNYEQVNSHSFSRRPRDRFDRKLCPYRLAVLRLHTSFDLRVDPQRRSFPHRAEKKRFEIKENFIFSFPISGWLMRNYRREISIPTAILHQYNTSRCVRLIGIGANGHFQ